VIVLSNHAGADTVGATWPRCNVHAESCWRQRYQGDLAVARCRCRVILAIMLPSHTGNGAASQGCTSCGKVVQPPRSEHRGVVTL
jgi:hypothetical protein